MVSPDPWRTDVALAPPAGWYPDPAGVGSIRWWSGSQWTDLAVPTPRAPIPPPVIEKRPWWRWLLYAAAIVLAGLLPMIVGVILWANPSYRRIGRITTYLSCGTIVLLALAFVIGGLVD